MKLCPKCKEYPLFWNSYFQRFMCSRCGYETTKEEPKQKMYVTMKVEGRYIVQVDASTSEEAIELANQKFMDADFGELSDIVDSEAIIIENQKGDFIWEK